MAEQKNAAKNEHTLDIRAGLPILDSKYGLKMNEFDYLDLAIDMLRDVKHFGRTEYYTIATVDTHGGVDLPCNIDKIDAVASLRMGSKAFKERLYYDMENKIGTDDYYAATSIINDLNFVPSFGFTRTRVGGGYIPYHLDGKRIIVSSELADTRIVIAFTGVSVDPEGYPKITRKQANAIAVIAATTILTRRAISGNAAAANMLELLRADSARLKQGASIPEEITDNDIDEILNIRTSFNRKSYKRPTKWSR